MSVDENVFNILRAAAFKNSENEATPAQHQRNLGLFDFVKE